MPPEHLVHLEISFCGHNRMTEVLNLLEYILNTTRHEIGLCWGVHQL